MNNYFFNKGFFLVQKFGETLLFTNHTHTHRDRMPFSSSSDCTRTPAKDNRRQQTTYTPSTPHKNPIASPLQPLPPSQKINQPRNLPLVPVNLALRISSGTKIPGVFATPASIKRHHQHSKRSGSIANRQWRKLHRTSVNAPAMTARRSLEI